MTFIKFSKVFDPSPHRNDLIWLGLCSTIEGAFVIVVKTKENLNKMLVN